MELLHSSDSRFPFVSVHTNQSLEVVGELLSLVCEHTSLLEEDLAAVLSWLLSLIKNLAYLNRH